MESAEHNGTGRVRLFVRDELPRPARSRRERVVDELEAIEAEGHVTAAEVVHWPKRFAVADTDHPSVREQFSDFVEWATDREVELSPFFGTRECYSMESGEKGDWVVLPAFCLAVFDGAELRDVYPHATGDQTRSVEDGLKTLTESTTEESRDRLVMSAP
ncbi:HTH domain-containing protein [Haloarculaceae archaeon H-GB2-1]|nr:hypothetical protein [Haloarculaceae archaeon H-GB1-1]MEA5386605.1 HTH domain-containing protein [Haloarculaceae archaeon H-GB11]MEA5408122.1 HTH domain-containing protein [Haloarculaceae archaeon H-GB2-1]